MLINILGPFIKAFYSLNIWKIGNDQAIHQNRQKSILHLHLLVDIVVYFCYKIGIPTAKQEMFFLCVHQFKWTFVLNFHLQLNPNVFSEESSNDSEPDVTFLLSFKIRCYGIASCA